MDTKSGIIKDMSEWEEELGTEELKKRIESGRLIDGLQALRERSEAIKESHENGKKAEAAHKHKKKMGELARGTKNQRKKARQLRRDSKKKNRKKK